MFPLTHLMTFSYSKDWNRTMDFPSQICSWVCLGSQTKSQRFCHHSKQSHHPHSCWSRNLGMICESFFFSCPLSFHIHSPASHVNQDIWNTSRICLSISFCSHPSSPKHSLSWMTDTGFLLVLLVPISTPALYNSPPTKQPKWSFKNVKSDPVIPTA